MGYSPTFVFLQVGSNIPFRKTVSAFFLVLFVAIHVVKAFHHHSETATTKIHSGACIIKAGSTCAVCDYHFIKDADAVTSFAAVQPHLTYLSVSSFYLLPSTTSIGLPSADRGPPAIV